MFGDYDDARSYFDAVRSAAQSIANAARALESMQARADLHGASIVGAVHGGGDNDAMRPVDAMLDWQQAQAPLMEQWHGLIDDARHVLYGQPSDGQGGAVALCDPTSITVVWLRCANLCSWKELAMVFLVSETTIRQMYNTAMDIMDGAGYDGCIAGAGGATD